MCYTLHGIVEYLDLNVFSIRPLNQLEQRACVADWNRR